MGSKDELRACTRVESGPSEEYKTFNRGVPQTGIDVCMVTDSYFMIRSVTKIDSRILVI